MLSGAGGGHYYGRTRPADDRPGFRRGLREHCLSAAFQSLDRSSCSLLVSLLRQIIFLLPIALLLIRVKPELVWLCFLLAELLTLAIAIPLYRKTVVPRIRALEG